MPHGVVTLTERYQASNISEVNYQKMVCEIRDALLPFERKHDIGERSLRVCSGSWYGRDRNYYCWYPYGIKKYDRTIVDGSWLDLAVIQEISQQLVFHF